MEQQPTVQLSANVTRLIFPIVMRALARKEAAEQQEALQQRQLSESDN